MSRKLLLLTCLAALSLLPACASLPGVPVTWRNPKDGMRFVWVPAGSFTAQVPAEKKTANDPEWTAQEVAFPEGFWLGRTEVTVGQFERFVRETDYVTDAERAGNRFTWRHPGFPQRADHPVVYVSYHDALSYARWAGVDLPTESEWLYACRAGSTTKFYWGDVLDDRYLWYRGNTRGTGTRPVACKQPNAWGLYDMVGNAWEYCKVGDDACFALRGASWTRCPRYRTRAGTMTGDLLAEAVTPRLQRCDPNPQNAPYPWDDDRGFRCLRRTAPSTSYPARQDRETASEPHRKEIEDLLHVRCAGCRNMEYRSLGGAMNTTLVSLEVPESLLPVLLERSDRLPKYRELVNKPAGFAFLKQFEAHTEWWRPSELEEARYADKTWITHRDDDPHFELFSTASLATGRARNGWVRVYVCYQAQIAPRSS